MSSSTLPVKKRVREGIACSGVFSANPVYHIVSVRIHSTECNKTLKHYSDQVD